VAVDNGVVGTYVTTDTQLAVAYNLDKIYVTVRLDSTNIKPVRVGQLVDKIGFDDLSALIDRDLVPDMNVTVHIHKQI
jgi:multidrug resistance efflux pump